MKVTIVFDADDVLLGVFQSHDESLKRFHGDGVYRTERPVHDAPNARVLTREQVETALNNGDHWWCGELDNQAFLDELFGEET